MNPIGIVAGVLDLVGSLLLKARDHLQPERAPSEQQARERFRAGVKAIRQAATAMSEEEIARDVEVAIREIREARRAASSR